MSIRFSHRGGFDKTLSMLANMKDGVRRDILARYGQEGVRALEAATPKDSSDTSKSWRYEITSTKGKSTLSFHNSHINDGVPIAIILQYGHATRSGGWVSGIDYINPAIQPIFDKIANDAWKEVAKV